MTFYETTENPVYTFKADEGVDLVVKAYQKQVYKNLLKKTSPETCLFVVS